MSIFSAEVLTGLLAIVLVAGLLTRRKRLPLPPGPPGLPILGNIYDVPKTHEWLAYQQWARDFDSDVIYLNLCGTPVVVVNSTEAAFELFERRSSLYSDRPRMTMLNDLVGCDWHFVFMAYGDRWRERRRIFHQHFHAAASLQHRTRVIKGARLLVRRLREAPEDFISHLRHMAGALIVGVSYGLEVKPKDDPYVETAEKALHAISMAGNAGAYLVDSIPTLKYVPAWFPGAKFKREAAEWRKACRAMLEVPFAAVKKAISDGIASPSLIVSRLNELNEDEDNSYQEGLYSGVAAAAYVGGSDTTVSALGSFFLAMLLYPDVQHKAQKELDKVIGNDRLPEFSDEASLPYISAVVKEVLRWRPVTPLAVPHRLTHDDVYKGYRIPAGTTIVGNAWAILQNEKTFPDPEKFIPERFLNANGQLNPDMTDAELVAFGFGRRICPGRYLAHASVFISVASVLSVYNIVKAVDGDGNIIEPIDEYSTGLVSYPLPFKCAFKPRSGAAESLIQTALAEFD